MFTPENTVLLAHGFQQQAGTKRLTSVHAEGEYLLLLFMEKGSLLLDGLSVAVQPFRFMLYPFLQDAAILSTNKKLPYYWMHLHLDSDVLLWLKERGLTPQTHHSLANPLLFAELWKLLLEAAASEDSVQIRMHTIALLFYLLVQNTESMTEKAAKIPHYEHLLALRQEIYAHPEQEWYIQDICDQLCISRPYFHKIYLAAFDISCTQDVIISRIAYAKKCLETSDAPIADISSQCGFETDVYFMRQFKRHVGMTPTAYRRLYRQTAASASGDEESHKEKII